MCCLFTWMAWCFDASHRLVVFIMACLISSSVCCLLLTASLAGVAMGYNYSLAEYIDLKETNISVYIKRGVYDDEISDDFDWRRSAGGDANIQLKDNSGLRSGGPEGLQPLAAGRRRSDNSVFESDDQNKYEGGLMRLTSTQAGPVRRLEPPEPPYTTSTKSTPNVVDGLLAVADSLPGGSLERLKAIQAAARHHEAKKIELATAKFPDNPSGRIKAIEENAQIHNARRNDQDPTTTTDKYGKYFKQLAHHPGFPGSGLSARKFMETNDKDISETSPSNRFRDAVFRGQLSGWPALSPSKSSTENFFEYEVSYLPSMPTPPTVKPLLVRPLEGSKPIVNWDMKEIPQSPIRRTDNVQRPKISDLPRAGKVYSDYDESHGLPMRKKRSGQVSGKHKSFCTNALLRSSIRKTHNELHTLNAELEISTNTGASIPSSDMKKSTEISPTEKLPHKIFNNLKRGHSFTSESLFFTSEENKSRTSSRQSEIDDLDHLMSSVKTKKKNVHFKPRKRMDSKGYDYKIRGNNQTKSIWWRISDGVHKYWHKINMYFGKSISTMSNKSDSNSYDNKQSSFFNKLGTITTEKLLNDLTETTETNTKRNVWTSSDVNHSRLF